MLHHLYNYLYFLYHLVIWVTCYAKSKRWEVLISNMVNSNFLSCFYLVYLTSIRVIEKLETWHWFLPASRRQNLDYRCLYKVHPDCRDLSLDQLNPYWFYMVGPHYPKKAVSKVLASVSTVLICSYPAMWNYVMSGLQHYSVTILNNKYLQSD